MKRFPLSKLTCLLTILLSLALMTAQVASAASLEDKTWRIVKSPNGSLQSSVPNDVAAISKHNVWAVGESYNSVGTHQTLIEHWNGTQWSVVSSPDPGSDNVLAGVGAVSANDIWTVGFSDTGSGTPLTTLIEHWNGTQWSVVPSPNPGSDNLLNVVATISTNDAWAVGFSDAGSGAPATTLIEHWNGKSWSVVPSPNPGSDNLLSGVATVSANDVWAVGFSDTGSGTPSTTLIEHWNGTSWSVVPSPNVGTGSDSLGIVAVVSAKDIWAVGVSDSVDGTSGKTLIEHWNGKKWSVVPSPNVGTLRNTLLGVTVVSTSDIWAVGLVHISTTMLHTLIEHWDGTSWSVVPSPNVGSGFNYLNSVSADSATDVWAVGGHINNANVQHTLIEQCC